MRFLYTCLLCKAKDHCKKKCHLIERTRYLIYLFVMLIAIGVTVLLYRKPFGEPLYWENNGSDLTELQKYKIRFFAISVVLMQWLILFSNLILGTAKIVMVIFFIVLCWPCFIFLACRKPNESDTENLPISDNAQNQRVYTLIDLNRIQQQQQIIQRQESVFARERAIIQEAISHLKSIFNLENKVHVS